MTSLSDFLPDGALRLGFGCGDLSAASSTAASVRLVEVALEFRLPLVRRRAPVR